jgi:hypothetical protein
MSEHARVADGWPSDIGSSNDDSEDIRSDPLCRNVLQYLREAEEPQPVSALTRHVAAEITDTAPEQVPDDVRRRVETWLHHGQLPALADRGIVEFDPESGIVTLTDDVR